MIIGCDFHTRYQQIAMMDEATGELTEQRLDHQSGEAQEFYRDLQGPVRVGIEATGPIRWFERLLAELGHELWIGDSAKIRASEVRKQKTDERDAWLILDLMVAKRFPQIWVPTPAERDLRQLLWHRHKLVCMRTMLGNQLHALALSEGLCRKKKLFTKKGRAELVHLGLAPWASRRRGAGDVQESPAWRRGQRLGAGSIDYGLATTWCRYREPAAQWAKCRRQLQRLGPSR